MHQTAWGQMMFFPMTAMEMLARSLQNWSQPCAPAACPAPVCAEPVRHPEPCCGTRCRCGGDRCRDGCPCRDRVYHTSGDRVSLIEYTLAEIGLGNSSRVLDRGEDLVTQCVTPEELQNGIIYEWAQKHPDVEIKGRNLRVYTKVLDSWCKPTWDYEEAQVQVLSQIRDELAHRG